MTAVRDVTALLATPQTLTTKLMLAGMSQEQHWVLLPLDLLLINIANAIKGLNLDPLNIATAPVPIPITTRE
jgi:uncharacterized membrane protein